MIKSENKEGYIRVCDKNSISVIVLNNSVQSLFLAMTIMSCVDKHGENSDKTLRNTVVSLLLADYTVFTMALSIIFAKKVA